MYKYPTAILCRERELICLQWANSATSFNLFVTVCNRLICFPTLRGGIPRLPAHREVCEQLKYLSALLSGNSLNMEVFNSHSRHKLWQYKGTNLMFSYLKGISTHGFSSTSYCNSNQGIPSQILICNILDTLKGKLPVHWQTPQLLL